MRSCLIGLNRRLILFFGLEIIAFCVVISFRLINWASTITLLIFSFLFTSLTFPLSGSILKKIGLLTIGNIVGLFWNFIFYYVFWAGTSFFGNVFNIFYILVYPFMSLIWIVSFWSLSISFLPKFEGLKEQVRH